MLTIDEAFDRLLATVVPLAPVSLGLAECLGLTLAEDVVSTIDSPPFDKSLMDGYAVRSADLQDGTATLQVIEVITAGQVPTRTVGSGEATQIMTGAPIPAGADSVVMVEHSERFGDSVRVNPQGTKSNLILRGTSVRAGDVVFKAGTKLNGSRIGALAELGCARVSVHRRPTVAILATGDELVAIDQQPGPGQIRNSNESMLTAQVQAAGAIPVPLGVARDNRDDLRAKIAIGLQSDLLVLSGGVSAGTLDLVPSELAAAGVSEVFHKVEMKPGKPIWFGSSSLLRGGPKPPGSSSLLSGGRKPPGQTADDGSATPLPGGSRPPRREEAGCYVFGLPGNPVSSLVCCELFVRTAIRRLMGEPATRPLTLPAQLEHVYLSRSDRPTYHPARLTWTASGPVVTLVPWHGSSDLCGTVAANAMAFLPGDPREYQVGDRLETIPW